MLAINSCKEKIKLSNNSECKKLEDGYLLIKQGKKKSAEFKEFLEYIKKIGIFEINIEDPISDSRNRIGQSRYTTFSSNLVKNMELDYKVFKKLLDDYSKNNDFNLLRIQYIYLSETILQELLQDIPSNDREIVIKNLEKNQNNLYAILTFVNKIDLDKNNKSYLVFNLGSKYYEIKIQEKDLYSQFKTNISSLINNPTYIAKSVCYNKEKVLDYIAEIDKYVDTCRLPAITILKFNYCYGRSKYNEDKESIFLTSIPLDSTGNELRNFPYYDQGSLEP